MKPVERWFAAMAYAAAMAWVEASVVAYLRFFIQRIDPYQPNPLPLVGGLGATELAREAATLVMLLIVGVLAGGSWRSRIGFAAAAFGAWDLLYYGFLKVITGWPVSLLDWDILFLIPLPWWGPVLAPAAIAALMVAGGTLLALGDRPDRPVRLGPVPWAVGASGAALALYCFTADAWGALRGGPEAIRLVLPEEFSWGLFLVALALLALPVLWLARQHARGCWPSWRASARAGREPLRFSAGTESAPVDHPAGAGSSPR